jgi:hypothetical protein
MLGVKFCLISNSLHTSLVQFEIASVNSSTKYSPFEVVFGSRPKFPLHQHHTDFYTIPANYHDYVVTQSKNLGSIREEIKASALKSGELMVERYNKNANPLNLSVV